jgi:NDP-hexose 4,6-dehydratase
VSRLVCDHTAVTELTGWTPAVELRDGLSRTLDWIRANGHRYRTGEYAQ